MSSRPPRVSHAAFNSARNPHRIKAREVLAAEGITIPEGRRMFEVPAAMDYLEGLVVEGCEAPACCDEGCIVEPDGRCEHGCPSILLALGLM